MAAPLEILPVEMWSWPQEVRCHIYLKAKERRTEDYRRVAIDLGYITEQGVVNKEKINISGTKYQKKYFLDMSGVTVS